MAKERVSIELFVMVDEDGDFVVTSDRDTLQERWSDEISEDLPIVSRVLTLNLDVELPRATMLKAVVDAAVLEATLQVASEA